MASKRKHTDKPNDPFYLEIRPLLVVLRAFARLAFGIKDGRLVSFPRSCVSLIWFVLYGAHFYLAVDVFLIAFRRLKTETSFFLTIIMMISLILTSVHFYLPLSVVLESGKICSYVNSWADFQDLFFLVTGTRFRPKYRKLLNVCLFLTPLHQIGVLWLQQKIQYFEQWYHMSLFFSILLIANMNLLFWIISFLEMAHAANLIKEIIEKFQYNFQSKSVAKLTVLWISLVKLIGRLSDSMYITMLVFITVVHSCGVTSAYAVISSINSGSVEDVFIFLMLLLLSCVLILAVIEPVHLTKIKVHDEIYREIIKIDTKKIDPTISKEFERFGEVVQKMNLKVTLGGFITIHRNLMTSMIGTAVTHLVVLVQFSTRQENSSS
ncbi:gustatory and odorant receptor 22-like [Cimex lectularius]|uniref:Gustatory receptor n=1 Tax=Cimex lectularius TaxID=79782 RepID=A0A8I6TKK2_CIMLE|nr:gustatory and odorant receptor 22-like [Cimex lectularius]XP_024083691.1 gustatory and odorant receptor 22-like [Cimex lectularius]